MNGVHMNIVHISLRSQRRQEGMADLDAVLVRFSRALGALKGDST